MSKKEKALVVRDSAAEPDVFVYVYARDGTGTRQCLAAHGMRKRPRKLTWCATHLIAFGVCVDCTQALGEIVFAS